MPDMAEEAKQEEKRHNNGHYLIPAGALIGPGAGMLAGAGRCRGAHRAWGPKVLDVTVSAAFPVLLAVLIAGAAGGWYILARRRNRG